MNSVPVDVGGQIMAFVPGPERFPARLSCRAIALWPTESVADVWLGSNEADRLRHPRRGRPHATAAIDGGWWRNRAAVVRIRSLVHVALKRAREEGGDGGAVATELFRGCANRGTALPDVSEQEEPEGEGATGWGWLRLLFPAARVVEVEHHRAARPDYTISPHLLQGLQPPPGVALVWSVDDPRFAPVTPAARESCRAARAVANDPSEAAARLSAALGRLCRGAYPRDGDWLELFTQGVTNAEAVEAVAASGFAPSVPVSTADARAPASAADRDRVRVAVDYLDPQASHVRLGAWATSRFARSNEAAFTTAPACEAAAGDAMAAVRLYVGEISRKSFAKVRDLRWPWLRELCVVVPVVAIAKTARVTKLLGAAFEWALALPRLGSLRVLGMMARHAEAVDALLLGLDQRAARGAPPLRLELEWFDTAACLPRLVAHPAVAVVGLRVGPYITTRKAPFAELQRICAALTAPGGPAVLRKFHVWAFRNDVRATLPDAALRELLRAQPLLRDLVIGVC